MWRSRSPHPSSPCCAPRTGAGPSWRACASVPSASRRRGCWTGGGPPPTGRGRTCSRPAIPRFRWMRRRCSWTRGRFSLRRALPPASIAACTCWRASRGWGRPTAWPVIWCGTAACRGAAPDPRCARAPLAAGPAHRGAAGTAAGGTAPATPPTLEALAASAGVSRRSLTRHIRARTGGSLGDFIRRARVARAQECLAAGARGLEAVAAGAGFPDAQALRAAFRRNWG